MIARRASILNAVALGFLLTSLAGCGVEDTQQQEQAVPEEVGTATHELNLCYGTPCPSGYHTFQFYSDQRLCGFATFKNARQCDLNTGSYWEQCESSCPSGYQTRLLANTDGRCCLDFAGCIYAPRYACFR
jgi:hypothetical protein